MCDADNIYKGFGKDRGFVKNNGLKFSDVEFVFCDVSSDSCESRGDVCSFNCVMCGFCDPVLGCLKGLRPEKKEIGGVRRG